MKGTPTHLAAIWLGGGGEKRKDSLFLFLALPVFQTENGEGNILLIFYPFVFLLFLPDESFFWGGKKRSRLQ